MTISDIAAALTGERWMAKYTGGCERPSRDEIARLAYHFYETHGRRDGHDIDDWLSAELELGAPLSVEAAVNNVSVIASATHRRNIDRETRHHRRHRAHWIEARDQTAGTRP
jgi:hypothetical protein